MALIGDVLRQLVADGLTVLLVEQKLPFARANADRFYIIDRGSNVVDGPIAELDDETAQLHLTSNRPRNFACCVHESHRPLCAATCRRAKMTS